MTQLSNSPLLDPRMIEAGARVGVGYDELLAVAEYDQVWRRAYAAEGWAYGSAFFAFVALLGSAVVKVLNVLYDAQPLGPAHHWLLAGVALAGAALLLFRHVARLYRVVDIDYWKN